MERIFSSYHPSLQEMVSPRDLEQESTGFVVSVQAPDGSARAVIVPPETVRDIVIHGLGRIRYGNEGQVPPYAPPTDEERATAYAAGLFGDGAADMTLEEKLACFAELFAESDKNEPEG